MTDEKTMKLITDYVYNIAEELRANEECMNDGPCEGNNLRKTIIDLSINKGIDDVVAYVDRQIGELYSRNKSALIDADWILETYLKEWNYDEEVA